MTQEQTEQRGFSRILYLAEEALCITAIMLLALLPIAESIARLVFKTGIPASAGYIRHLLLVAGLAAGMITARNGQHLAIAVVQHFSGPKVKGKLHILTSLISVFVTVMIAWASLPFIKIGIGGMVGFIPIRAFTLIIPLAFIVIAVRFARLSNLSGWKWVFPVATILAATFVSFPSIAKFIWGFDIPEAVFNLTDAMSIFAWYVRIPVMVFLLVAAVAGTPLFVVMGGIALLFLNASEFGQMDSVVADIYTSLINPNIIAIPLFTLVGFFLSESKAGERLVYTFRSLFSWLPGGIILATVVICAFFTSFTGASGVTILALGGILYTILSEHMKYPEKFSIGLLTSVGSIGVLFPPSLPIILVGATSQTNILHMFMGGILPGIVLVLAMIVFGVVASIKVKIPVEKFEGKKVLSSLKGSALEILLPVILIVGYFSGTFQLYEIGAVAVLYIIIVEVFIHRDIKITEVPKVFIKAIPIIGGILAILALSKALSSYIVDTQAPTNLAIWMHGAVQSRFVFLLLLNLVLLLLGCFMDIFSAILIVLPLIIPLGQLYGIDPVHLGIIFITNMEVGFLTPPVGLNLFLASYRFNRSFVDICRYVLPFLAIRLIVILLITYIPFLSTWLPRLLG